MLIPAVGAVELDSVWRSLFLTEDHGVLINSNKINNQRELPKYKARHAHHKTTVTVGAVSAVPKDATAAAVQVELSSPQSQGEEDFPRSNSISQEPKCTSLVPWNKFLGILFLPTLLFLRKTTQF